MSISPVQWVLYEQILASTQSPIALSLYYWCITKYCTTISSQMLCFEARRKCGVGFIHTKLASSSVNASQQLPSSPGTVGFITQDFHALISRQHSQTNRRGLHTLFLTSTRQIWGIWKLRLAYSPETPNLGQNRWCFVPCDLEIWRMTLENDRASLLCFFKLCATFHSHWWIQTGVTVRKRPFWVKFDDF